MSINVFTFSGNVGKDMEVRATPNGKYIGQFSLPCKSGWGDNEKVSWITCKVFGERAEKLAPYVLKGSQVTVAGAFVLEQWEKDGVKHSIPCCLVDDIQLSSKKVSTEQPTPQADSGGANSGGFDTFDDDIPF